MKKALIIDDDQDICHLLVRFLSKNNFEASSFETGESALEFLREQSVDVILCDYKLPDINGVDLLRKIRIFNPDAVVIIITGYSDIRIAVDALKHGAYDYVVKPLYPDEILHTISDGLKKQQQKSKTAATPGKAPNSVPENTYVQGKTAQAQNVEKLITLIAPTDMSVIIIGETGTGKEFVANAIHRKSNRKDGPFIDIDCGAIPKELAGSELFGHVKGAFTGALQDKTGSFELANGGTLFLDEIGNLSYENQIKLLRVLQERSIKKLGSNKDIAIDVRLIVATNEDLKKSIADKSFREDIFHRLNEFQIELTPLRERPDDILIYGRHFLNESNRQLNKEVNTFNEATLEALQSYPWHGNLRELRNVIKRAVLLCEGDALLPEHLPSEIRNFRQLDFHLNSSIDSGKDLKQASEHAERRVIIETLEKVGFNKSQAAKELNIDRKTLYNKLKAYNIDL